MPIRKVVVFSLVLLFPSAVHAQAAAPAAQGSAEADEVEEVEEVQEVQEVPGDATAATAAAAAPTDTSKTLTPNDGAPKAQVDTHVRASSPAAPSARPAAAVQDDPNHLPWIFTGLAVALGMGGAVVGLDAIHKYDELEKNCTRPCEESRIKSLTTRSLTADLLYAGAGASLITAIVLFALEDSHETHTEPSAKHSTTLSVAPIVDPQHIGATGRLVF